MKRSGTVIIKTQIHPIAQLFFDQIQRRRLGYTQIVAREQPNFYTAVQGALQILQQHAHTAFHQEGNHNVDGVRLANAHF